METDKNELKQRNNKTTDNKKTTESESESGQSKQNANCKNDNLTATATASASASTTPTNLPTVIRTKEEYFDALRVWLQQVQLQQMAYAYFPYYLSANLPPNMNNVFNTTMPFPIPPPSSAAAAQFPPAFPPVPGMGINGPPGVGGGGGIGLNFANAGGDALNRGGPFIGNSIFQNRNQYMENMRQNMQILYQNGGYEYTIAPIWKRVLAEAIDVSETMKNKT